MFGPLRAWLWRRLRRVHGDVRVVAFLRACSVVGIVVGFSGFMIGLNPFVGAVAMGELSIAGETLPKLGVAGLLTHLGSLFYYIATKPTDLGPGLLAV